jgi:serine/threonine-protein kinase PpkA
MLESGTTIGKYRIVEKIGAGGMADVYRAEDTVMGREVAMKVLPAEFARDAERVSRFEKEVRNLAALDHSNIVTIYDVGRDNGCHYYSMAMLAGGDLKERIKKGLSSEKSLEIVKQLADALGYAHRKGLIHRDIKPENIMFDSQQRPVLTDLGIAKAIGSGTRMTKTGMSIGTPHYMSPEQARGQTVDGRSDLYSLGVVFYEMLTGRVPFDAEETFAVAYAHINEPVPELPHTLSSYQPLIDWLLAKNPEDRFVDAAAVVAAIEKIQAGRQLSRPAAATRVMPQAAGPAAKRRRIPGWTWALAGALAAILIGGGLYSYQNFMGQGPGLGGGRTAMKAQAPPAEPAEPAGPSGPPEEAPRTPPPEEPSARAALEVRTDPPGADIRVNGEHRGTSPLTLSGLPSGTSRIRAEKDGYETDSRTIKLTSGRTARVSIDLAAVEQPGRLYVRPEPEDARVRIMNIKPPYHDGIELSPGRYEIEVSAEGHDSKTQWIRLASGEDRHLSVELDPVKSASPSAGDIWTEPTTGMEFVWVPGGCYQMGSNRGDSNEKPVHEVCVDGFWMGKTEVTRGQFRRFIKASGHETDAEKAGYAWIKNAQTDWKWQKKSGYDWEKVGYDQSDVHPVVCVSWNDARAFAQWLSEKAGRDIRMPSEAEWEYAARGGTTDMRFWGGNDGDACRYANVADKGNNWSSSFPCDDGYKFTAPAGNYRPNQFGLYDMLGNVWEWCQDVYDSGAYSKHSRSNPVVTSGGSLRVGRGGSWSDDPRYVRCANRDRGDPGYAYDILGFRLCAPQVR